MEVKPGYKQSEAGIIPQDWSESTVGEQFEVQLGKMVDAAKNHGELKPYLGNAAVKWGRFDLTQLQMVPMSKNDMDRYRLLAGDLLVCEGRGVGRSAIWADELGECYYQKALHRLRARRGFNPQLMVEIFRFWVDQGRLTHYVTESTIPHLTKEKLVQIPLAVPSPLEQQNIVQALSDVNGLFASLDKLITKKRDLKQAAMQQLLTGRTRLPGFRGEWEKKTLGEIGDCVIGLTYQPEDVVEHGTLVLRASNIQDRKLSYEDCVFVERTIPPHLFVREGDILVCVRNGSRALIGKCVRLDKDATGHSFGAFMSVYRTPYSRFLVHVFQSDIIQRQIHENIGATINQITNKDMKSFRVELPPIEEQKAIAEVLSDMDAEIAALEERRNKTKLLKEGMMQELLTGRIRLV